MDVVAYVFELAQVHAVAVVLLVVAVALVEGAIRTALASGDSWVLTDISNVGIAYLLAALSTQITEAHVALGQTATVPVLVSAVGSVLTILTICLACAVRPQGSFTTFVRTTRRAELHLLLPVILGTVVFVAGLGYPRLVDNPAVSVFFATVKGVLGFPVVRSARQVIALAYLAVLAAGLVLLLLRVPDLLAGRRAEEWSGEEPPEADASSPAAPRPASADAAPPADVPVREPAASDSAREARPYPFHDMDSGALTETFGGGDVAHVERLAREGNARAQFRLGHAYAVGAGRPQSFADAAKWHLRAAEQGLAAAQFSAAWFYGEGRGVPQDFVAAHVWLNLAAARGSRRAGAERARLESVMTDSQVAEAQGLARERSSAPARAPVPAPSPAPPDPMLGETVQVSSAPGGGRVEALQRYQVEELVGEGTFKRVYRARDTVLDRLVALSVIKTNMMDEPGQKRLQREVRALARLADHPHIVTLYDIVQEGDQTYLVSQYMAGGDLRELVKRGPDGLPVAEAVRIGAEVCRALAHVHEAGLLHRDVKPSNVWLTTDRQAKLGDFGLATSADGTRMTQAGSLIGSLAFMCPEIIQGKEADARSDLYSFGAMFYEMLTGRLPFTATDIPAMLTHHLQTAPEPPSHHNAALPAALDALTLRLLAKAPDDRPPDAMAVVEALREAAP